MHSYLVSYFILECLSNFSVLFNYIPLYLSNLARQKCSSYDCCSRPLRDAPLLPTGNWMENISIYVEHPQPIMPPAKPTPPPFQALKLTKKELKKHRVQRRLARKKVKQEMIRLGLIWLRILILFINTYEVVVLEWVLRGDVGLVASLEVSTFNKKYITRIRNFQTNLRKH